MSNSLDSDLELFDPTALHRLSAETDRLSPVGSRITRSETRHSLEVMGITQDVPQPDINAPPIQDPIFPEEYTMETKTGLVRAESLRALGRTHSRRSAISKVSSRRSTRASSDHGERNNDKESDDSRDESICSRDRDAQYVTFLINDPANPHNWNPYLRWFYTIVLSVLVISAAYGLSCLAGGLPKVAEHFNVSDEVAVLTVSLMVLGFCIGPLIWAPLSEQIGRRWVYFISFGLYTIFQIPCALAPNIACLCICRFLCGVFSSSALTNVGASLVDLHKETRSLAIAFFSFAPYSGPVFGAVVNGFVSVNTGDYTMIIWANMAFAGVMWIAVSLMPETYAPVILKNRAKQMRAETGDMTIMTEQEASPLLMRELVNDCLIRPLKFIVTEPMLDLVCGFVALIYSLLYAFFFAYPVIFAELYGYKDDKIGLMYIPILIGALLALTTTPYLEKRYALLCKRRQPEPEDRLVGAMIGSPFPMIALFILGATLYKHIIWVGPASSGIAFGYGMVLIYYSLNNYIIDTYAKYAASALATKVFLRSAGGAAFPLFTAQMYHNLGLQWASWLLAFISMAMILIPFSFYRWGKGLRARLCKEDYTVTFH